MLLALLHTATRCRSSGALARLSGDNAVSLRRTAPCMQHGTGPSHASASCRCLRYSGLRMPHARRYRTAPRHEFDATLSYYRAACRAQCAHAQLGKRQECESSIEVHSYMRSTPIRRECLQGAALIAPVTADAQIDRAQAPACSVRARGAAASSATKSWRAGTRPAN